MNRVDFDIKYRPEIESGKYKVQTRDGQNVRIICWDARISSTPSKKNKNLVCLHEEPDGTESIMHHFSNGKVFFDECKADLVILTDEPELTRFEDRLLRWLYDDVNRIIPLEELKPVIQSRAKKLLDLARKEIESKIKEEVVHDYWQHTADLQIQAKKEGYNEALKDLPKWSPNDIYPELNDVVIGSIGTDEHFLIHRGRIIHLESLEKLPGFKED